MRRVRGPRAPLLPLQLALLVAVGAREARVSAPRSLAWGPGLQAAAVLPVRYFFLQAVDPHGRNLTGSPPGQTLFKVVVKSLSPKELVRIYVPKPLDRNDGTFLVRYRMHETVHEGLKIEVFYGGEHVAQSPYILKGPVYHEYCDCPEEDPQAWQKTLSCPTQEPQIEQDFASFPRINLQQMLKEVPKRFGDERGAVVHYTILNNHIYRRSLGKYTDFKMFSDEILLSLARKVLLPDLEFYINLGDWPLEHRKVNDTPGPIPIISWCGSLDSRDIILPTYDITHSTLEAMRGVTNDLLSIQGNTGPSWINKTEKAFFRGRDSREERLQLVQLAKENPQLLDAGITGYFFFQEKEKELGKAKLMGFFDFFKYKYQVNVDGTVAAYRYPYLMLGDSLVLKQDSPYYEHFYVALRPWRHYIPIKRNLSDLLEKVKWAKPQDRPQGWPCPQWAGPSHILQQSGKCLRDMTTVLSIEKSPAEVPFSQENDEEAKKIAREGQLAARDLLQPPRLYCYYYRVLQDFQMPGEQEQEFTKQDMAARVIQRAWKNFLNVAVFQHFKSLIDLRRQGEPRQIVRFINPKEAELLDAAAGIQVRFRLGGVKFPPEIYYKIFTHRHIEDLCANSPRDYTKLPSKHTSRNKDDLPQEEDHSGWYRRVENNGWRPVSQRFWIPVENEVLESTKESEFHFSKLKRRQDLEKKRKIKKIEWMRQMYYAGSLEAKATNHKTLGLIHTATKGLIKTIEDGGVDSVMEWEVDEVLNWTNTLNFDEYIARWKETATSNSSAHLKDFRLAQIQKSLYKNYEDVSEMQTETPYEEPYYDSIHVQPQFTRLTPDSTF